jgi:hypothetical protein
LRKDKRDARRELKLLLLGEKTWEPLFYTGNQYRNRNLFTHSRCLDSVKWVHGFASGSGLKIPDPEKRSWFLNQIGMLITKKYMYTGVYNLYSDYWRRQVRCPVLRIRDVLSWIRIRQFFSSRIRAQPFFIPDPTWKVECKLFFLVSYDIGMPSGAKSYR